MDEDNLTEGWKFLFNARKCHYFRNGESLCGRWMTWAKGGCTADDGVAGPDDCRGCRTKLDKERAT